MTASGRHVKHFNYNYLRNAFRTALLNEPEGMIGTSFKKVKAKCYSQHKHGFYVYAKPNLCDPKVVTKYIGRYLGRPVIATSRIDRYDEDIVTFHYNRHEDEQYVEETLPAIDFIKRLIRHIPEKYFKMIRYGGLYARHRKIDSKLHRVISKEKHRIYRSFTNGERLFSFPSVMILCIVLNVITKWSSWNCITTIGACPSKNCTRKSCPNLVECVPLHSTVMI